MIGSTLRENLKMSVRIFFRACPNFRQCLLSTLALLTPVAAIAQVDSILGVATPDKESVPSGSISGRVVYSDTRTPARTAQIILVPVAPDSAIETAGTSHTKGLDGGVKLLGNCALDCIGQTGLDGRFSLHNVPEGKYIVLAQQPGAVNPLARIDIGTMKRVGNRKISEHLVKENLRFLSVVTVQTGKTVDVNVNLEHGATIAGTITYDDGSPAIGVQLHLLTQSKNGSFEELNPIGTGALVSNTGLLGYTTDDLGRFRIPGLLPGAYAIRASIRINQLKNLGKTISNMVALNGIAPDAVGSALNVGDGLNIYNGGVFSKSEIKPIVVSDGGQKSGNDITIPLDGLHSVGIRVEDGASAQPLSVAQVQLLDAEGKDLLRTGFVDDHGECELEYVPNGAYTLRVLNAMDVSLAGKPFSENYDMKKIIRYRTAEMKIQVNDDISGIVLRVSKESSEMKSSR